MYTLSIKLYPHQTPVPYNTQEIVLDIASNLMQIGKWTLKGFRQQQPNIELFLKLTRKNVKALSDRELSSKFRPTFDDFCKEYDKLEDEYKKGITDHQEWANVLHTLANSLNTKSHLA